MFFCIKVFKILPNEYEKAILGLLTLFSWIRGISYFRIFNKTRYLIRLLQESIEGVLGFLIFFSYLVIASSMFNMVMNNNQESAIFYIAQTYNLALGTLEDQNYDIIQ